MLINYDTSVEEIKPEDYKEDHDLTLHYFPGHKGYSLIMMYYQPLVFYNKVARNFTFENWNKPERTNQLKIGRAHV